MNKEHVYVIFRLDSHPLGWEHIEDGISAVKVLRSEENAEREVKRLNDLNGSDDTYYFMQISRLVNE